MKTDAFEDDLRQALAQRAAEVPGEAVDRLRSRNYRPRSRNRVLVAGAVVVTAAAVSAAVAVAALPPASHPASHQPRVQLAAWTVTRQADGIIHVTITELRDPAGLQATLRADGVPASVSFGNGQQTACQSYPGGGFNTTASPTLINSVFPVNPGPPTPSGVNIQPSALPSGTGVLLASDQRQAAAGTEIGIEAAVVQASQQCTGS
jgi:hypothetical protein